MKSNRFAIYLILFTGLLLLSCTKQLYRQALSDAAHPATEKISEHLTVITSVNPDLQWKQIEGMKSNPQDYVLMASWKKAKDTVYFHNDADSDQGRIKFYATKSRPIFVTAFPDLQKWYQEQGDKKDMDKRLIRLLGLPPDTAKRVFILFWVRPQDLARPCVDPEVTDHTCDFKINTSSSTLSDCDHLIWLTQFIRDSYSDTDPYKQYPFTQLGYTYDWKKSNKQHVGLSEFVIGKDKYVRVAGIYGTDEFLKANKSDLHLN